MRIGKLLGLSSLFNQGWLLRRVGDINLLINYLVLYGIRLGVFVLWLGHGGYSVRRRLGKSRNFVRARVGFLGLSRLAGLPPFGFFLLKFK